MGMGRNSEVGEGPGAPRGSFDRQPAAEAQSEAAAAHEMYRWRRAEPPAVGRLG